MALKKTLMLAGAVTTIGLAGATAGVQALSMEPNDSGRIDGLVSKIASEFNLNEGEVQAVFDEHKADMKAEHEAHIEARLDDAVANGEITVEQKATIMAKLDELKAQRETDRESFMNMTREERRQAMKERHEELKAWAEENNLPDDLLKYFGPIRVHKGPGMEEKVLLDGES